VLPTIYIHRERKQFCHVFVFYTIYCIYNQHFCQLQILSFFSNSVHLSALWDRCLKLNHYAHNDVYEHCVDTHTHTHTHTHKNTDIRSVKEYSRYAGSGMRIGSRGWWDWPDRPIIFVMTLICRFLQYKQPMILILEKLHCHKRNTGGTCQRKYFREFIRWNLELHVSNVWTLPK